ncbi:uncharacterized protein LOC127868537 isoform X2 [Dreissena polymorpha]|uniref:uncharacterized protein LOC127868537 isoform X2 n=1 Tax=Dreissena polymorpha TaxID=45954 RepID=UPI0022640C57|nr:uncharacterized protein LOC127868537 isoform X2 [Dreissena polymorpha]
MQRIDVDNELEKMDKDVKKKEKAFVCNKEVINPEDTGDATGLTEAEKQVKANREKDKGNEAFWSKDFKEALTYYSRSISLLPTAASYNNRALAHLKLSQWHEAISDVNTVMEMEPDNVKALMRRGIAYKGLKMFEKALRDMLVVAIIEPQNKKAKEAVAELTKANNEKKKTGKRMKTEDQEKCTSKRGYQSQKGENYIGKGDHLTNAGHVNGLNEAKKPARRMTIEEVEDDGDKNNEIEKHIERHRPKCNEETRLESTECTIANNNSQRAKVIWNEDEVNESDDNARTEVLVVEHELVASDRVITKSNSTHQLANGLVEMTNCEQKNENNDRSSSLVEITVQQLATSKTSFSQSNASSQMSSQLDVSSETKTQSHASTGFVDSNDCQKNVPKESPKELFEKLKAEGNALVKQGKFKEAIVLYTQCDETLPDQTVVYTNRALCYIRNNQATEAEGDCTRALALEKDNVKALFRRAQARKIMKKHREGIEDLSHLLKVDPKNTAAKQEMEVLKNYWVSMGEGGYLREKTDHERATRQRGFPQVPWERESIETCTVMNSLCYGSEIRQARRDAYREQDRIMSAQVMLTTITTGSKAEGVTDVFEGDRDIMFVLNDVICLEKDVSSYTLPMNITVFTLDTDVCYHGHCILVLERPGTNMKRIVYNALCFYANGRALLSSDLYVNAYDELKFAPENIRHERAGPSTPRSFDGCLHGIYHIDMVHSLRCYCPSILRKWAERRRHWPTPDVVHKVVSMGAFLTPVSFKGSEHKHLEWRICFNTGENYLVSCLNNTQIYIYVLLKMIIKQVVKPLKKELTSYTVKNMVLWIAENNPQELFNERTLFYWLREGLVELRSAIITERLSYFMIPDRNLMAACDMEECQKRLWVQIISDMIEEGPTVLRRLPKIRHAINFHPEPLMWFSSKVLEIELLVLKYINRDCRDKNGVFNESDTMLQVIFRRTIETLDEVEQRMKVIGSRDFTEAINIVFGC